MKRFEESFAGAVGAPRAIAMNSCTAALHLAVHALGLRPGDGVLVPTMTFAATAEVVRYEGAIPILVDCDPRTLNMDLERCGAQDGAAQRQGPRWPGCRADLRVVGMIPVHVGGLMMNVDEIKAFAQRHDLWVVEDAAHAFPAAWRQAPDEPWQHCGQQTAAVSCFSFYANKTITTGEGGMAVTADAELAAQLRLLSLHGLSHDAWGRYSGNGSWDYRILAPGYKYNMTDVAAAIGHSPARARRGDAPGPRSDRAGVSAAAGATSRRSSCRRPIADRIHAWHLFPIRLRLETLDDRSQRLHQRAEPGRRGVLGALAAAAPPSVLRGDVRLASDRSAGRVRRLAAAGQPAAVLLDATATRSTPSSMRCGRSARGRPA